MENKSEKLNIYQKLLKIQQQVKGFGKDGKSFGYQYVTGTKVLEHVKPLMNDMGLILKQEVLSIENTRQDYVTAKGVPKNEILSKVMMRFTWIDCQTGEKDENLFGANGQNDWEKGLGSSLTYAERYFLLKYFHIATDEDDIDNPDRKPEDTKTIPVATVIPPPAAPKADLATAADYSELFEMLSDENLTKVVNFKTKPTISIEAFKVGIEKVKAANTLSKVKFNEYKTFLNAEIKHFTTNPIK